MKTFFLWIMKHWIIASIAVVAGISGYMFFGQKTTTPSTQMQKFVEVTRGDIAVTVTGSGQIVAESQVNLKPVAAGDAIEVISVNVKNDQEVKKGQLIAVIDSEDALRDVHQAELSLKSAKIKMQQTRKEYAAKNEDETLVRRSQELSVTQQELALEKSLSKLADYSIRAPFDGIVTGLDIDSGDTISQTSVIASVITKQMKADITLNEVDAVKIHVGDRVNIEFNALPGTVVNGRVVKVDTIGTVSQGVVSYGAEILFDEQKEEFRPGMSVTATIIVAEKKNVLLVPNEALSSKNDQTIVSVVSQNTQTTENIRGQKREIVTGMTNDVMTEVSSGVQEGEQIIVTTTTSTSKNTNQTSWLNTLLRGGRTEKGSPSR